jgi:hypothetical protein
MIRYPVAEPSYTNFGWLRRAEEIERENPICCRPDLLVPQRLWIKGGFPQPAS